MEKELIKDDLEEEILENPNKQEENDSKELKEVSKKESKTKNKWIKPAIIVLIILIAILLLSTIFAIINVNNQKIISGISIKGIDVSGLTKEEAKEKIDLMYNEKKEKEIDVKYQEYETTLNPTMLEVNYDTDKATQEAYLIGRNSNIFVNNFKIIKALIFKDNIDVEMNLNEEILNKNIADISVNIPGIVEESSYSIEDDELIITKGKEGIIIDKDQFIEKIKKELREINNTQNYIEIPVINKTPDAIDIDKIYQEVCKEAKDAYYTEEPFTVYPEQEGISFNLEEARAILAEDKEEYIIKLTITKPKVTINDIGTKAFPNKLSTFTTRYDASNVDRSTNLKIACQKINEKVLLVGETFSYNNTLGPRTVAAGYKNGKVYENGQVVDGIGGGICQISSTLYNAVLMADLQIVERRNHQFVTSYLPAGRDATVAYGVTDFKFKNTRKYPIRIVASAQNGIATVSIYGIKEENEYTFSFSTKTIATIPYTIKYEEDASLSAGTEKVKQAGTNGIKTQTYMTKSLNGKVVSTTLLSTDTYNAMARIIVRGKGSSSQTQTATPSKPQQTQPSTPSTPTTPSTSTTPSTPTKPETETKPDNTEKPKEEDKTDNTTPTGN